MDTDKNIYETSGYTLDAGQTSTLTWSTYGPIISLSGPANIAGRLTLTSSYVGSLALFGAPSGQNVTIASTGSVTVHGTYNSAQQNQSESVIAFAGGSDVYGHSTITNNGLLSVTSDYGMARGVDWGGGFVNNGTVRVTAGTTAQAVFCYWYAADFVNAAGALIEATGGSGALGVLLDGVGQRALSAFENGGTIRATSTSNPEASIGVSIGGPLSKFVNTGTITAYTALSVSNTIGDLSGQASLYVNSGTITGLVLLDDLADTLQNTGTINGTINLGLGNDKYDGAAGTQSGGIFASGGDDTLIGGASAEYLFGEDGNDVISAGAGNDFVDAGRGDNSLDGGAGFDTLCFLDLTAPVHVDLAAGTVTGAGSSVITNFEEVIGSSYDDTIAGSTNADVLAGGSGNDWLTGGGGNDTFLFARGDGQDTITDFAAGGDKLKIYGYTAYQSLTQVGSDTCLVLSATDSILLKGVTASALTAADFSFNSSTSPWASVAIPARDDSATYNFTGSENYVVHSDEVFTFSSVSAGFEADVYSGTPSLSNYGRISLNNSAYGLDTWCGHLLVSNGDGTNRFACSQFLNAAGASFTVNQTSATQANGIYTAFNAGMSLTNLGTFTVTSVGSAYGVQSWDSFQVIDNRAEYRVSAGDAAWGIHFHNDGTFTNSGNFTVTGKTGAIGIEIDRSFDPVNDTLTNSGTITVTSTTAGIASVGLKIGQEGQVYTVHNSGTIIADVAIQVAQASYSSAPASFVIDNSGTIIGAINLANGANVVRNSGRIEGNISLGAGNDTYDGTNGRLVGNVDGGGGSNTVIFDCSNVTGTLSFSVPGDTAAPLTLPDGTRVVNFQSYGMVGGSGANSFLGGAGDDLFWGGSGTNNYDGGAGTNTINFANATGAVTISLATTDAQNVGSGQGAYTLAHVQNIFASPFGGTYTGNSAANTFTSSGGTDTFIAGSGNATFVMGASFAAGSTLVGGMGTDVAILSGDYSSGVVLSAANFSGIEKLVLQGLSTGRGSIDHTNYAYKFTAASDLLTAGQTLTIDAYNGGSASLAYLYLDLSAAVNGTFNVTCNVDGSTNGIPKDAPGWAGTIIAGGGSDVIRCGMSSGLLIDGSHTTSVTIAATWNNEIYMGAAFNASDKLVGGQTVLDGDYSAGVLLSSNFQSNLVLTGGHNYAVTADNGCIGYSVVSGSYSSLFIDGSALGAADHVTADASAQTIGNVSFSGGAGSDILKGGTGADTLIGNAGADALYGGAGYDTLLGGDEHDTLTGGAGNDTLDGGSNIDTAVFAGNRAAYTITQGATGVFTVSGSDGTDTLSNVEYAKFDDQTVRLLPGTGTTIDWNADPSTYMAGIRDFDGNDVGAASGWKLIGTADVDGDGVAEHILVNRQNGRWAEVGTEADGKNYLSNYGWAGDTRVVGIYIDPLVTSGEVVAGSDFDSQRRFQNDLNIENIHGVLGQADYNHDGLQEIYFSLTDGTAYLHAYMHADGNIQYANYQNEQQVKDYLTANGFTSAAWAGWFPAAQTALATVAG